MRRRKRAYSCAKGRITNKGPRQPKPAGQDRSEGCCRGAAIIQHLRSRIVPQKSPPPFGSGAPGADSGGRIFGEQNGAPVVTYAADWKAHGRAAGPIRNQRMIDGGKPDLVITFPGGRGTADMVRRAEKAGIEVTRPVPDKEK